MSTDFEKVVLQYFDEPLALPDMDRVTEMVELFGPTEIPPEIAHENVSVPELFQRLHQSLSTIPFIAKRPPNELDKRRKEAHKHAVFLAKLILEKFPDATAKNCLSNKDMRAIYDRYKVRLPAVWYFRQKICKGMFSEAGRPHGTEETKLNLEKVSFLPADYFTDKD